LDEIHQLPPTIQAKLLRFMQEKSYYPVGGTEVENVNVRIIAATNHMGILKDEDYVNSGFIQRFGCVITVPPLNERKEDIPALIDHFADKWFDENKKQAAVGYFRQVGFPLYLIPSAMRTDWENRNIRGLIYLVENSLYTELSKKLIKEYNPINQRKTGPKKERIPDSLLVKLMNDSSSEELADKFPEYNGGRVLYGNLRSLKARIDRIANKKLKEQAKSLLPKFYNKGLYKGV